MMRGDGGNKARSPGRSRISRKTIAQGRPVVRLVPVVLPRAFLLHADQGGEGHPVFPAPPVLRDGGLMEKPGRHAPRERGLTSSYAVMLRACGASSTPRLLGEAQSSLEYWIARS